LKRTLIIGYGNVDRQDDGIAWHVLASLAGQLGRASEVESGFDFSGKNPELMFVLQLMPELAETVAQYERVCFVDAHTGSVPEEIHAERLIPEYQPSPFTHHLTAATLLAISHTLYGSDPQGLLLSVRGYEFGFDRSLSAATARLLPQAVTQLEQWLAQP
jgi:hydrogenase maturation protease